MKNFLLTFSIILTSLFTNAQEKYDHLWLEVERIEINNLPKSANKKVEEIYAKAVRENNSPQIIKCLVYKSKFALILEEDATLKVINNFKTHINNSNTPTKNVLQNMLANLYWQYFQTNRYKFYRRTKTENKVDKNDFRTWDLDTLFQEIHLNYNSSIENSNELQKIAATNFKDILNINKKALEAEPTLFDFLAKNALNFYKTPENSITKPAYLFKINDEAYLKDAATFANLNLTTKDTLSLQFKALKVYQKLTQQNLKTNNLNALANIDVERINFVKNFGTFDNVNKLLLENLNLAISKNKNHKSSGLYFYEIAKIYNNQANEYVQNKTEGFRFKNQEALTICNTIIEKFPDSDGALKCAVLKNNILQKRIQLTTEKHIPIQLHSRILVSYRNVSQLYFKAYHITPEQEEKLNRVYYLKEKKEILATLHLAKSWEASLRDEKDYLNHTTEVIIPKLNQGNYVIIASEEKGLNDNTIYGTTTIQVTNLTLVNNTFNNTNNYQVLDRNTGKPIANAEIHLKNEKQYRQARINKKLKTDANGFTSFKSNNYYRNVKVTIITKDDTAVFGKQYISENYSNKANRKADKTIYIKPFVFTDRSIYRPGQKVHYKVIALKKQGEKSEVFTNEYIEVSLSDANGQTVKTVDVKLNEFGSASGEFDLPNNGLTGEFEIIIDKSNKHKYSYDKTNNSYNNGNYHFQHTSHSFSVEEYKRPKFAPEFKPVTDSYKINDEVTVTGFAKAFSGANITDAKVEYRVHRKVQYPAWCYWRRPNLNTSAQEITHGETTTNNKGEFDITFKAIPDETASPDNLPIFTYEIAVDVTDVNGETRSTTTNVKVGYHSLLATIQTNNYINKNEKETVFHIDTKNLNNEFVAAKGTVKIYKLQAPKFPLRKRAWNAPDYQDISKNEFLEFFPHEPYTNDTGDIKYWKKGKEVFNTNFNTEKTKEITVKKTKKWDSGAYIVVLETEDKFGQKVKDEKHIQLFSSKDKTVADNKLFSIKTDKNSYKPNENVSVQIGSASEDITVIVQLEKNHKIIETKLVHLSDEIKTLKFPVTSKDVGGFAIKYHWVNYNSFGSGNLLINVPEAQENIEIITNVFRDKLQPGAEETWSFTVKNDKEDKIAAEVLASMYDASLDEFTSHNWNFNPIPPKRSYYSYNTTNANWSFSNTSFNIKNIPYNHITYPQVASVDFNWFGFHLTNRWANNNYLSQLKPKLTQSRKEFDGIITGIVTSSSDNLPLPGVSVIIVNTVNGTDTDFDGNYEIKVKKGDVLQFSSAGFKHRLISVIGDYSDINIKLEEDASVLEEVVVVGYGKQKRKSFTGAVSKVSAEMAMERPMSVEDASQKITIRGAGSLNSKNAPLIVVDGVIMTQEEFQKLNPNNLGSVEVLKDAASGAIFGSKGANGVILITTKTAQEKLEKELNKVQARKNLQETAFFFPQLKTNENGEVSFSFTMPEALTKWKLQLLAHNKELLSATKTLQTVTQKELMVIPNAPRFLREGDKITLSAKITNLSDKALSGVSQLILTDAVTGKEINTELANINKTKNFTVAQGGNIAVAWELQIPPAVQSVQYKIVAKAGDFSDGEQNVLPVLTNRMLVTETLPMWVKSGESKTFSLDKLKSNSSSTLVNHKLTLEVTSNPVWYAVQALPYLMEYPYECAEQTFSRYYANTIASYIANSSPKIQEVFNAWKTSEALLSNLEKNQELKSLLIQETPWLRDAQSESEQKKRIALLFDLTKMKNEQEKAIYKLKDIQKNSGGFPWFKGGRYESNFITQHIATGFGHLKKIGATDFDNSTQKMIKKAVQYLDDEFIETYNRLLENAEKIKLLANGEEQYAAYLAKNNLSHFTIQYLYMRSFYKDIKLDKNTQSAFEYYQNQSIKYWNDYNLYAKGQIALSLFRNEKQTVARSIIKSLKENSITSEELGMYWKENTAGYYYYQAPVETQALLIEAFSEIENNTETVDNLKIWLLKNKQTNQWKTTKATTEAIYALLLKGTNWIAIDDTVDITVGNKTIDTNSSETIKKEAGTGYFKTSWNSDEITSDMATINISKKDEGIAWGGLYWQYFEDLDKITSAKTPLQLSKKLFLKTNSDTGKELQLIDSKSNLKVGDLITVRIELKVDRPMEFVHMKDMRASGVEPINVMSQYKWQDGLGYYESTKDASTNFFFDRLPKGVYVFEYDVRVNNAGDFSNGITTIQSMYAPEFSSHSKGERINVK